MAAVQNGKLFSCGNHSFETTRGMLHFGDGPSQTICILSVPSTMTARDIIHFLNPSMEHIENTRIIREVNHDSHYTVLVHFRNQDTATQFYVNYDGVNFNSIEEHVCKLLYVTRIETFSEDPSKIDETSNCTVCLDRMYPDVESIITILCNHSFHVHCLSKWGDTTCPVCRYNQTPECQLENKCMECSYDGDSLWMCIICGHVACGRYINGHAYDHFTQTQHTYAMQLTDNQVWDYAGDNYVHRLLANKTDGKPVEVEGAEAFRQAEEKVEAVQMEYEYLLMQQLESQRKYYEKLIKDAEKQCQKDTGEANAKRDEALNEAKELKEKLNAALKDKTIMEKKMKKIKAQLTKLESTLEEEKQMNKCLTMNQEQFQSKLKQRDAELEEKAKLIAEMEEAQKDLMTFIGARDMLDKVAEKNDISRSDLSEGQLIVQPSTSSSNGAGGDGSSSASRRNNRRKKK